MVARSLMTMLSPSSPIFRRLSRQSRSERPTSFQGTADGDHQLCHGNPTVCIAIESWTTGHGESFERDVHSANQLVDPDRTIAAAVCIAEPGRAGGLRRYGWRGRR